MSIIPIETNFTGMQRKLVPKCMLIDVYDLRLEKDNGAGNYSGVYAKPVCVLAGGSIITNITLTTALPVRNVNYYINFDLFVFSVFDHILTIFDSESKKKNIGPEIGNPLSSSHPIKVIAHYNADGQEPLPIVHLQCLIEYLAEESP